MQTLGFLWCGGIPHRTKRSVIKKITKPVIKKITKKNNHESYPISGDLM